MSNVGDHPPSPFRPPAPGDLATQKRDALSGKIMLSAIIVLFAAVVLMLFLHMYARCYLLGGRRRSRGRGRRTHLVFYVGPTDPAGPSRGLDPVILNSLPTFTFSSSSKPTNAAAYGGDEENIPECAVCLSEFQDGENGRRLPKCNHSFHVDCIDMWFHSHSTCPLCRTRVDGESPAPAKGEDNAQSEIDVELAESSLTESTHREAQGSSQLAADYRPGPSAPSSFGGRRKGMNLVGVSIEVPARSTNFSFRNSDELGPCSPAGQEFKSPTSRLLSLKRILSREKKPVPSPSSPCSGIGTSGSELAEIEAGLVETRMSQTRPQTPR